MLLYNGITFKNCRNANHNVGYVKIRAGIRLSASTDWENGNCEANHYYDNCTCI